MNKYKLYNTIRNEIQLTEKRVEGSFHERYIDYTVPRKPLHKMKFSFKYLREMLDKYEIQEFADKSYCCENEDHNCWIDVEGYHHGWVWVDNTIEETHKKICDMFFGGLKRHKKELYKRNIFYTDWSVSVYEENPEYEYMEIAIPLRDVAKSDYYMILRRKIGDK